MRLNGTIQKRMIPVALALSFALILLLAPAASAAQNPPVPKGTSATSSADVAAAAAATCYVVPAPGVDAVSVRTQPKTSATRTGLIYPGQRASASCAATAGGSYTCPRGSSTWWVKVTWNGRAGYVAERCVYWNVN
jgi:hypothetical protein